MATAQPSKGDQNNMTSDDEMRGSSDEGLSGNEENGDHCEEMPQTTPPHQDFSKDNKLADSNKTNNIVSPSAKMPSGSSSSSSFPDLSKVISSNSYLAAALKASLASSSSRLNKSKNKSRSPSPQNSPTERNSPPSSSHSSLQQSLSEASFVSSLSGLLKEAEGSAHLSSLIQGFPLLSSMLPALRGLAAPPSLAGSSGQSNGITCVCGVKYNSSTNLEAHRMFYCTHRQVPLENYQLNVKESPMSPNGEDSPEGGVLRCPHCPFTTTLKLSLNGHMNIHTNPEERQSTPSVTPKTSFLTHNLGAQDKYCTDCDIQFSSIKTFKVHKAHYCQTRHVLKGSKSPAKEDSPRTIGAGLDLSSRTGQPVLALATNPVLLIPYSMIAEAQLLPQHVLPQLGAAFIMPNGQVHPLPTALDPLLSNMTLPKPFDAASKDLNSANEEDVSKRKDQFSKGVKTDIKEESSAGKRRGEGDSPLDLSTSKRPKLIVKTDLLNDEEKENREVNSSSEEPQSPLMRTQSVGAGEFEGKLLLSSPTRHCSSAESEEKSYQKSPRPSSSSSGLMSPRANHRAISPKPSSSGKTQTHSPSQVSPVAAAQAEQLGIGSLPPGFSSHFMHSLESLGGSIPLGLQCLQRLQGLPRDLALKLMNPELLLNGIPPVLTPPVIVKQGEAKCNECNIVFYKEESLQIHKKHYCSANVAEKSGEDEQSGSSRNSVGSEPSASTSAHYSNKSPVGDVASTSSVSQNISSKEATKDTKPLHQFMCTACGIKFSSPDNLSAHQTYYCPKREGIIEDVIGKGVWRCPRCRIVMTDAMQAAHQCATPSPTSTHGWKCPCCPVLSPTAAAAQKHLETHAGIKAFKCTICGYRGNTLRGMRTHIRMHFEKKTSDLQEENFITCILEEEEPRQKNERKMLAESSRMLMETSPAYSGLRTDPGEHVDPPLVCAYCPFMTPLRMNLLQHLAIVHKVGLGATLSQEISALLEAGHENSMAESSARESSKGNTNEQNSDCGENQNSNDGFLPSLTEVKLEPEIKLEIQTEEEVIVKDHRSDDDVNCADAGHSTSDSGQNSTVSNNLSSVRSSAYFCRVCNISFSMIDSYNVHKRFYCSRPDSRTPPETVVQ